jgi:hypothetical protein
MVACGYKALQSEEEYGWVGWLIGAAFIFYIGYHYAHPLTCVTDDVSGYTACTAGDDDAE